VSSRNKRLARARKKRQAAARQLGLLESGSISLRQMLESPQPCMGPVRLWTVMKRTPKMGEAGIKRTLQRAQVWPETKLEDLTPQEVQRVLASLPPRAQH
jgi:hypothetical protein